MSNSEVNKPVIDVIVLDERITNEWGLPEYKTPGSAGIDLMACIDEVLVVAPGEVTLIPTGLKIHVEDPSLVGMLVPRSGLGHKHGIILGNSVGIIDADYQGQTFVSCWNRSDKEFTINPSDRICQMLFVPVVQVQFNVVDSFDSTERGEGGFGSTGIGEEKKGSPILTEEIV